MSARRARTGYGFAQESAKVEGSCYNNVMKLLLDDFALRGVDGDSDRFPAVRVCRAVLTRTHAVPHLTRPNLQSRHPLADSPGRDHV